MAKRKEPVSKEPLSQEQRYLLQDFHRRKVPVRPAQGIGNVLSQLLAKNGYAQLQTAASCEAAWRQAAGPKLEKDTRPGNVRGGVLDVLVRNSAVLQELTFVKQQLVRKLAELAPDQKIKQVKFRVGNLD